MIRRPPRKTEAWVRQAMRRLAPASSARERSRVNVSPVLALAGLAAIGLLATRLPRPAWPRVPSLDPVLAAGGLLVAVGLVLGPGIGFLGPTLLGALAPVTALALGWLGAMLGARFEWRYVRRVPREVWLCAALSAVSAFVAAALSVTLALTVPLALHRSYAGANAELGWLASLVFAVGGGALVGMAFLSVSRLRPAADLGFALVATLLFGAGLGYAADLSPLIVCALAAGLIVNTSTRRRVVREMFADWSHPLTVVVLIVTGALLTLPTAWILGAAALVALVRVAAQWGAVRLGRDVLRLDGVPRHAGLATVAQGATALALGVNFFLMYGGHGTGGAGGAAVLATVVGAVAVAQLAAPALLTLALRAGPARLTPAPETAELSPR